MEIRFANHRRRLTASESLVSVESTRRREWQWDRERGRRRVGHARRESQASVSCLPAIPANSIRPVVAFRTHAS